MLAIIRPTDWNVPLFVHVLGAMVLVGTLLAVLTAQLLARRAGGDAEAVLSRFVLRVMIAGVLPSFVVMRIGAEWVRWREGLWHDTDWVLLGYLIADPGAGALAGMVAFSVLAKRRAAEPRRARQFTDLATLAVAGLLAAYVVAIWAMTAKPDLPLI